MTVDHPFAPNAHVSTKFGVNFGKSYPQWACIFSEVFAWQTSYSLQNNQNAYRNVLFLLDVIYGICKLARYMNFICLLRKSAKNSHLFLLRDHPSSVYSCSIELLFIFNWLKLPIVPRHKYVTSSLCVFCINNFDFLSLRCAYEIIDLFP